MHDLLKAFRALSDETRLRILNVITERECCVCEVMRVLDISQTRASRNLNILYDAGFLKLRKEGLWAYYSIDKACSENYLSRLLSAVEQGLNNNKVAALDKERLKEAKPFGPEYCHQPEGHGITVDARKGTSAVIK